MSNIVLSNQNSFYEFSIIYEIENIKKYNNKITTLFVVNGIVELEIDNKKIKIFPDQGVLISPQAKIQSIVLKDEAVIYEVIPEKKIEKLIEFVDEKNKINEEEITNYKILDNHKKVKKPWGYELWIVWLKDYHVLKKIFLKKDFKTSLQYHQKKFETNYIQIGKAKIINNFHLDNVNNPNTTGVDYDHLLKNYSKDVDAPFSFTVKPHEVHRIFSIEDCTSYEVSTPQLDDVIRLQDDAKRESGRIFSEHK